MQCSTHFWSSALTQSIDPLPIRHLLTGHRPMPSAPSASPSSEGPLCCVHDGVSVLVVPRTRSSSDAIVSIATLKVQFEGQADDEAVEVLTALPAGSVRGVALHGGAIIVWSATHLEAYALARAASASASASASSSRTLVTRLTLLGALPLPAPPAAVAVVGSGDGVSGEGSAVIDAGIYATVFVAVETRVQIYRLPSPPTPDADTAPHPSACLAFTEREGRPTHLDAHGPLLAAATEKGCFKLFDTNRHPPRQLASSGLLTLSNDTNTPRPLAPLHSLRINADGSWASLLAPHHPPHAHDEGGEGTITGLFLYDVDRDVVRSLPPDFFGNTTVSVTAHAWDACDPGLLACELRAREGGGEREVVALFVAASTAVEEEGTKQGKGGGPCSLLDRFPLPSSPLHALVAVSTPRLYMMAEGPGSGPGRLLRRTMRAFVGLDYEGMDDAAQAALRAFHSHLLRGDLPAAYRAGARLRNPVVWENMARLCVRARRLDAAALCLGQMGHARGVRALREAQLDAVAPASSTSVDNVLIPLAAAATQLGMLDEASKLYREARRPDLLLRLLMARGKWEEALAMVDKGECPLWRRRVHYEYAGWLEAVGRVGEAAGHYAVAGAQHRETPRMLLLYQRAQQDDEDDDKALARYVASESSAAAQSPALLRWWAAHCEARGRFAEAKAAYRRAGAWAELVRLACYEGDVRAAEAIIAQHAHQGPQRKGDSSKAMAAACFRLAQHLEGQAQSDVLRAMEYYAKAGCYNHCVRLARAHGLDGETAVYALKGPPSLMRDAARHFARTSQNLPLALQLYTKAKDWKSAIALCLRAVTTATQHSSSNAAWLVDAGREIAQGLLLLSDANLAPALAAGVAQLAGLLEGWGHPEEAVQMHLFHLTSCPSIETAHRILRICRRHAVPLTEGTIDRLLVVVAASAVPPTGSESKGAEPTLLSLLLLEAARVCEAQGQHASASRLYTQAGNRRKALECLLALGDADGAIRYASAARRPELLLLAGEHLWRSGLWRRDERVRAAVGEFLVRGKAEEAVVRAFEEESGRCRMLMKGV